MPKKNEKVINQEQLNSGFNSNIVNIPKLIGKDNWHSWKRQVRAQLLGVQANNAIVEKLPVNSKENVTALSIIISAISHNLLIQIPDSDSAFDIWKSLVHRFEIKHNACLFNLIDEIEVC